MMMTMSNLNFLVMMMMVMMGVGMVMMGGTMIEACNNLDCGNLTCYYGFNRDENDCQLCECTSRPICPEPMCDMEPCEFGLIYQNGCHLCECNPTPPLCPELTCTECPKGNLVGKDGCWTCNCSDPCYASKCGANQKCVPNVQSSGGYVCQDLKINNCCPIPVVPKVFASLRNYCQTCDTDCSHIKCGVGYHCCADWYGCYKCQKSVRC